MIPEFVKTDLVKIKQTLREEASKIALFGSILHKPFDAASDVDIVIFMRNGKKRVCRSKLLKLALSLPITPQRINGSYWTRPDRQKGRKDYHIILLDANHPNPKFMELNANNLVVI